MDWYDDGGLWSPTKWKFLHKYDNPNVAWVFEVEHRSKGVEEYKKSIKSNSANIVILTILNRTTLKHSLTHTHSSITNIWNTRNHRMKWNRDEVFMERTCSLRAADKRWRESNDQTIESSEKCSPNKFHFLLSSLTLFVCSLFSRLLSSGHCLGDICESRIYREREIGRSRDGWRVVDCWI